MRKRKDSFFGLHYDFHANRNSVGLGDCNVELIDKMLSEVKPDFVQCDTKGHAGISSYPTKVGNPAPEMKGDLLKTWRELTKKHDVALYAHHSGVWDTEAVSKDPDWAVIRENGEKSNDITSVFGPYVDELLIPQLIEMAKDYGLNGAWVDGECWATNEDYSHHAVEKYRSVYGKEPPHKGEEGYFEYMEFCRNGFLEYVDHYMREVHKVAPDFQLISNWLYTMYVPKRPEVDMDSISGDYDPNDSVNTARIDGRCIMSQQKPWDLMAWGFGRHGDYFFTKTAEQLCQEAAAIIMLGGGFQVYNRQVGGTSQEDNIRIGGSIQDFIIPGLVELAKFCRAREDICFKAEPVHQIGILYSEMAHNYKRDNMFSLGGQHIEDMKGVTLAVIDNAFSAEILMTHHIMDRDISDFGMIIVPDLPVIEPELKEKLLDYAKNGGKLLVMGVNSTKIFEAELGVTLIKTVENAVIDLDSDGFRTTVKTNFSCVDVGSDARVIGEIFTVPEHDSNAKTSPVATVREFGKGAVGGVYFNVGAYRGWRSPSYRAFVKKIINSLYTPSVRVISKSNVDLALMKKNGALCVNLMNLNGEHADRNVCGFDCIPPLRDVLLEIDLAEKPVSVRLEPDGIDLEYTWDNGVLRVCVDKIEIHSVVVIK